MSTNFVTYRNALKSHNIWKPITKYIIKQPIYTIKTANNTQYHETHENIMTIN